MPCPKSAAGQAQPAEQLGQVVQHLVTPGSGGGAEPSVTRTPAVVDPAVQPDRLQPGGQRTLRVDREVVPDVHGAGRARSRSASQACWNTAGSGLPTPQGVRADQDPQRRQPGARELVALVARTRGWSPRRTAPRPPPAPPAARRRPAAAPRPAGTPRRRSAFHRANGGVVQARAAEVLLHRLGAQPALLQEVQLARDEPRVVAALVRVPVVQRRRGPVVAAGAAGSRRRPRPCPAAEAGVGVDERVVDVQQDAVQAGAQPAHASRARSARNRARLESRPRISIDSNSGGETRRPVTATRSGPNANFGLMPSPSTSAARSAASIAAVVPLRQRFQRRDRRPRARRRRRPSARRARRPRRPGRRRR